MRNPIAPLMTTSRAKVLHTLYFVASRSSNNRVRVRPTLTKIHEIVTNWLLRTMINAVEGVLAY
jgi:hypothetical protein